MATVADPPRAKESERGPALDPEAVIEEARRRQRRRRVIEAAMVALLVGIAVAVWQLAFVRSHAGSPVGNPAPPERPSTLTLHLVGWGAVVQGFAPGTSCPDGVISVPIRSSAGHAFGSVSECDLVVSKAQRPNGSVLSTHANMLGTYHLPGGTILTHEQRTFHFSRDQMHTNGRFTGRIIGGSGRYAHARGSITGGGPGGANTAHWTVVFHFH
jgi:hypothetical protein